MKHRAAGRAQGHTEGNREATVSLPAVLRSPLCLVLSLDFTQDFEDKLYGGTTWVPILLLRLSTVVYLVEQDLCGTYLGIDVDPVGVSARTKQEGLMHWQSA